MDGAPGKVLLNPRAQIPAVGVVGEVMAVFVERLRQLAAADVHVHLTSDDINPDLVHQQIYPDPPAKS